MTTYKVLRQHIGDKEYQAGETREAEQSSVAHLVAAGVLAENKAAPAAKNKAEPAVANKAAKK